MKKYFGSLMLIGVCLLLSGCATNVKTTLNSRMGALLSADQENEQGFVLTSDLVYEGWYPESNGLKLSGLGLTQVPDICELMNPEDHPQVWHLDISNNSIRIVDQDLSCLVNLKSLNLSYNEIEVVKNLGSLPTLNEFKLQKNNLTTTQGLPDFPALQKLNIGFNQLTQAVGLDKYTNLESLELYHNQIQELVGIENLQKLQELKVEFNNIKDFAFVETLKQQGLELMTAKGNEIKDSVLDELKQMNNDYLDQLKQKSLFDSSTVEISVPNE